MATRDVFLPHSSHAEVPALPMTEQQVHDGEGIFPRGEAFVCVTVQHGFSARCQQLLLLALQVLEAVIMA